MPSDRFPWWARLLGALASAAAFGAALACILAFDFAAGHPRLPVLAAVAILGAGFAFLWPVGSWRWGPWTSAASWLYFGFVFASLAFAGQADWLPAADAAAAVLAGSLGAWAGARLARHRPESTPEGEWPSC